jgi:hypothetical protein
MIFTSPVLGNALLGKMHENRTIFGYRGMLIGPAGTPKGRRKYSIQSSDFRLIINL